MSDPRSQRPLAPSAPSADQLRQRLLSPRQKGSQLRPATHSHTSRTTPAGPADDHQTENLSDTLADSLISINWNISNFEVVKSEPASLFEESRGTSTMAPQNANSLTNRLLFGGTRTFMNPPPISERRPATGNTLRKTVELESSDSIAINFKSGTQIIEYFLKESIAQRNDEIAFVHVTSRFNVEKVLKPNYYDIVFIGIPGNTGDLVAGKGGILAHSGLKSDQIMQVSRKGILVSSGKDASAAELVPLKIFILERDQFEALRRKRFFNCFRECKVFRAWHLWARHRRIARAKRILLENSFFSHSEIASTLRIIQALVYDMETNVQLFSFHGTGSICVSKYFELQVSTIRACEKTIISCINAMAAVVSNQFSVVLSGPEYRAYVDAVINGHPFKISADMGDEIDWVNLRSVQRLEEDCRLKLENILCRTQYMVDAALGRMLGAFWSRCCQFVKGIRSISRRFQVNGYWDLGAAIVQSMDRPKGLSSKAVISVNPDGKGIDNQRNVSPSRRRRGAQRLDIDAKIATKQSFVQPEIYSSVDPTVPELAFLVDHDWLEEGSHAAVDVALTLRMHVGQVNQNELLVPENIRHLKIRILPTKKDMIEDVHGLFGAVGALLEKIPNLRSHPIVNKARFKPAVLNATIEISTGLADSETANWASKGYFTRMHLNPLLNNSGALDRSIEFMQKLTAAYNHAGRVELRIQKFEEAIKKLCALNPEGLVKQMNYSLVLPKLVKVMESPDTVDDLHRAMIRDRGRLTNLQNLIAHLETSTILQNYFLDIKHHTGMVTSFRVATEQLATICEIQKKRLFSMLPNAFLIRARMLTEYLNELDSFLDLQATDLAGLVILLKKLKNFESGSPLLELECEICETMYSYLESQTTFSVGHEPVRLTSILTNGRSPEVLMKNYIDCKDRLFSTITRGKSLLLGMLSQIKKDVLEFKVELHKKVRGLTDTVLDPKYSDVTQSSVLILSELTAAEVAIRSLNGKIIEIISTQEVLTIAHDIVGAATAILAPGDIDKFIDMQELLQLLQYRLRGWKAINEVFKLTSAVINNKLGACDVRQITLQLNSLWETFTFLKSSETESKSVADLLETKLLHLRPKLELIAYLSSSCLRVRHFKRLGQFVFEECGYSFKFSGVRMDVMSVVDMRARATGTNVGALSTILVSDLLNRGVGLHIDIVRVVTAEALMESMIEKTLQCVEDTVAAGQVSTSTDWLRDSKLREKIFFELFQAVNLTQLSVLVQFCMKAVLILEQLSLDMHVTYFTNRIDAARESLQRLDRFIENIREIQYKWFYVFHHVKFSGVSELDRDSAKSFQVCTEELKRIELAIQQKSGNLLLACNSMVEYENNIEGSKQSLTSIMEDAHSNIQSLLDGAPRLSLVSYNRLHQLVSCWMIGAHLHLPVVSDCFHDMFEGVGFLQTSVNLTLRAHFCTGFVSYDSAEIIIFDEPITFNQSLPKFVKSFEYWLRKSLIRSSDELVLCRIQAIRSLLSTSSVLFIVSNLDSVFQQRIDQLLHLACSEYPNQSVVLLSNIIFAEDIWTCLGHPTGCISFSRNDLNEHRELFAGAWRQSLSKMIDICKANLRMLQEAMRSKNFSPKLKVKKAQSLYSSIFLQEVAFLRTAEQLASCSNIESASELWAGKYQVKYLYNKDLRSLECPFDIVLGCVTVPYGLEYQGANVTVMCDDALESALQKVVSSATCSMATVLVSRDDDYSPIEAAGEFAISCKDIAFALGRICIPFLSVQTAASVRFFLSRLTYLDAIGCVDFTNINREGLQLLSTVLTSFWKALDIKQDVFIQESLKFPLKTKFGATEAQMLRRKDNLIELRETINFMTKHHKYPGLIVLALASETQYSDPFVFVYFSRNVFNAVSVSHGRPVEKLGLYLAVEGYMYAFEVQEVMVKTITELKQKYSKLVNLMAYLSSSAILSGLVIDAGKVLSMRHERLNITKLGVERFKLELDCFGTMFWEYVMVLGDGVGADIENLRIDALKNFQELYVEVTRESEDCASFVINTNSHCKMVVPRTIRDIIRKTARDKGLWMGGDFTEQCASLWNVITNPNHSVVILSGSTGCGKSSVLETVIEMIRQVGIYPDLARSNIGPIKTWRAGFLIARVLSNWYRSPQFKLWKSAKPKTDDIVDAIATDVQPGSADNSVDESSPLQFQLPEIAVEAAKLFSNALVVKNSVKLSVIHHTSMSGTHFLGGFDSLGRWNDGILLRKIRQIEVQNEKDLSQMHVIVLDGPLGYYSEQIFGSSHCLHSHSHSSIRTNVMAFPSGEICRFSSSLRVIFESDDVAHASPAFLVHIPHFHCIVDPYICCDRLVKVWMRSLSHWLGNFPPWREIVEEIRGILVGTPFITEILFYNASLPPSKSCLILSKLGAFFRIMEELLSNCHSMAKAESTFVPLDSNESEIDSGSESQSESETGDTFHALNRQNLMKDRDISKLTMTLGEKGRDRLRLRARLSIVYAAIWGFGGPVGTDKNRRIFESVVREKVFSYFDDDDFELPKDISLFSLVIDFQNNCFIRARPFTKTLSGQFELPQRLVALNVSAEFSDGILRFHSPQSIALCEVVQLVLRSGGHPLITGEPCTGKTLLVNQLLDNLKKNLQSPQQVQKYLQDNLVEIIGERKEPEGEALTLLLLREALKRLSTTPVQHDSKTSFVQNWRAVNNITSLSALRFASNQQCIAQTVFSSKVSLQNHKSAEGLRGWFDREFSTEIKNCLEAPRFAYGVVFVDDLHIAGQSESGMDNNIVEDRPEALLKGILSATPIFGIRRNYTMRLPSAGFLAAANGDMERNPLGQPILHRSFLTDPRILADDLDDYILQYVGMIACATGSAETFVDSPSLRRVLWHFGIVGLPPIQFSELHAALIMGSYISLTVGAPETNMVNTLRSELIELCNITLAVCKRMVSSVDAVLTTDLEKSIRSLVNLDINLIAKFCGSLQLGSHNIRNPGGLLQLFVHEWKRNFLDPFPMGAQRERFVLLFKEEMESIDIKKWLVSSEWLATTVHSLGLHCDRVWTNPSIFTGKDSSSSAEKQNDYMPVEMVPLNYQDIHCDSFKDKIEIDCTQLFSSTSSVISVLYPAAMSMVLRFVRILSRGGNILTSSFHGTSAIKGLILAAKLSQKKLFLFDIKSSRCFPDGQNCSFTADSFDFKKYLKSAVLRAAGFINPNGAIDEYSFNVFFQVNTVSYERTPAENILLVVSNSEHFSTEQRRYLMNIINPESVTDLFQEFEIIGLAESLRIEMEQEFSSKQSRIDKATDDDIFDEDRISRISIQPNKGTMRSQGDIVHTNSHYRGRHSLTGYAFQWVKKHLCSAVQSHLQIALSCQIPRSTKILLSRSIDTDKSGDIAPVPTMPSTNLGTDSQDSNDVKSNAEYDKKRRFSLLSGQLSPGISTSVKVHNVPQRGVPKEIFDCRILGSSFRLLFSPVWWELDAAVVASSLCSHLIHSDGRFQFQGNQIVKFSMSSINIGDYTEYNETETEKRSRELLGERELKIQSKVVSTKLHALNEYSFYLKNFQRRNLTSMIGIIDQLGLFRSLAFYNGSDNLGDPQEESSTLISLESKEILKAEQSLFIRAMKDEVSAILPRLLLVPSRCDALILTEPVFNNSIERTVEFAVEVALSLIDQAAKSIFVRRYHYSFALQGLIEVDSNMQRVMAIREEISAKNLELGSAIRDCSGCLVSLKAKIGTIQTEFGLSPASEIAAMLKEEYHSRLQSIDTLEASVHASLAATRNVLFGFSQVDWFGLAAMFAAKPGKELIDTMKTVMSIINFVPPEPAIKKKGKTIVKSEADIIARCSITMLRSADFVNQLVMVNPMNCNPQQLAALALLQKEHLELVAADNVGSAEASTYSPLLSSHPIIVAMKEYLFCFKSCHHTLDRIGIERMMAARSSEYRVQHELSNHQYLADMVQELHARIGVNSDQIRKLEVELQKSKKNLDALQWVLENHDELYRVLVLHRKLVESELVQIDDILLRFACDTAIAASVFARSSWLPEDLRQYCLEDMRAEARKHKLLFSDSPFICGLLSDDRQIRRWAAHGKESVSRDVSAINCVSLACMSPVHTFIIDPDAVAEHALQDSCPSNYNYCTVSGQRFSLQQLELWSSSARSQHGRNAGCTIVVTDAQAGISDDLVAFLSAELQSIEQISPEMEISNFLEVKCNPIDESYPQKEQRLILCRLRLYIISCNAPVVLEDGKCFPIPGSCFKNIAVVHWVSLSKSFIVESNIELNLSHRRLSTDDHSVKTRFSRLLEQKICTHGGSVLEVINEKYMQTIQKLDDVFNIEIRAISHWVSEERDELMRPFCIESVIEQIPIQLGFLSVIPLWRLMIATEKDRYNLSLDASTVLAVEREHLAHQGTISEVFSMAVDFLRAVSHFVDPKYLPPLALSPRTVAMKCIGPAVNKAIKINLFYGIPASPAELRGVMNSVLRLQRAHRRKLKSANIISNNLFRRDIGKRIVKINQSQAERLVHKAQDMEIDDRTNKEASHEKSKSIHHVRSSINFPHFKIAERSQSISAMHCLLFPLRRYFLKEIIEYVLKVVCPGREWMVKFSLLLTMWSKSSVIPSDELRVFQYLLRENSGDECIRYGYIGSVNKVPMSQRVAPDLPSKSLRVENFLKSRSSLYIGPSVTSTLDDSKASADNDCAILADEVSAAESKVLSNLANRVTAFRIGVPLASAALRTNSIENNDANRLTEHKSSVRKLLGFFTSGLSVNAGNPIWRITEPQNFQQLRNIAVNASSLNRIRVSFSDGCSYLKRESTFFGNLPSNAGDSFEIEWLYLLGARVFSIIGLPAAALLGGSNTIIEGIASSLAFGRAIALSSSRQKLGELGRPIRNSIVRRSSRSHSTISNQRYSVLSNNSVLSPSSRASSMRSNPPTNSAKPNQSTGQRYSRLSIRSGLSSKNPSGGEGISVMIPKINDAQDPGGHVTSSVNDTPGTVTALYSMLRGVASQRSTFYREPDNMASPTKQSFGNGIGKSPVLTASVVNNNTTSNQKLKLLLAHPRANMNLDLLENHSAVGKIFKGVREAMNTDKIEELLDWKRNIALFGSHEFSAMSLADLKETAEKFTPPNFIDEADDDEMMDSSIGQKGLWLQGYELSVIQTIIFGEAVNPGSAEAIVNAWFGLLLGYLNCSGKVITHLDEMPDEDDDCGSNSCRTDTRSSKIIEEDEENEDDFGDRFDFRRAVEAANGVQWEAAIQGDVFLTNCWTKLRRVLTGESLARGSVLRNENGSNYCLTYRDFENWEAVLGEVLQSSQAADKYTFMSSLRSSIQADGSIFLCEPGAAIQCTTLSQRARNLSIHNNSLMHVINCDSTGVLEITKQIRNHVAPGRSQKTILEMLDISSPGGNSLLCLGMSLSNHGKGPQDHFVGFDSGNLQVSSTGRSAKQTSKGFPFIVSSIWGNQNFGVGPVSALGDLNFVWLPRYSPPDVVRLSEQKSGLSQESHRVNNINAVESGGVMFEELERCLLWVMLACRQMTKANISPSILRKLRHANKIQVRSVSSLVAIRNLVNYMKSAQKESVDLPPSWSDCIVPLSLWQLARILMKTTDILEADWSDCFKGTNDLAGQLRKSHRFAIAIEHLVESFGISANKDTFEKSLQSQTSSSPQRSRKTSISVASSKLMRPTVAKPKPPSSPLLASPSVPAKLRGSMAISSTSIVTNRLKKKAAAIAARSIDSRLEQMRSVNRFSVVSKKYTILVPCAANSTNPPERLERAVVDIESTLHKRMMAGVGGFMSEMVIMLRVGKVTDSSPASYLLPESVRSIDRNEYQGRLSMKLDIQNTSLFSGDASTDSSPTQINEFDVALGSLDANELIQCLARWTLLDSSYVSIDAVKQKAARRGRISKLILAAMLNQKPQIEEPRTPF